MWEDRHRSDTSLGRETHTIFNIYKWFTKQHQLEGLNFADDTLLYSTFNNTTYKNDITNLNSELENISNFLKLNKLKFYLETTRFMLFHPITTTNINFDVIIDRIIT